VKANFAENPCAPRCTSYGIAPIPAKSTPAIIPTGLVNYPSISYPSYCNNITLKSDASGDASLLGQANLHVSGIASTERYITGYSSAVNGWHFLSSPMNSFSINGSDFVPTSDVDDFYRWNESSYEWLNYYGGSFGSTVFENGLGYLVAYSSGGVKNFMGTLNTTSITQTLSYTFGTGEGAVGDGWNLLGNPYSSAIDWTALTKTGDIDAAFYIVNPVDGTYLVGNGSGTGDISNDEIPMNQGFFVKANSAGQSIIFETADQIHSSNDFNKSSSENPSESLKIVLKGRNSENSTFIQFREDASSNFDHQMDAYKLFGFAEISQVYTELENTQYAINCLSHSTETISIPLSIHLLADEVLEFSFIGLESFDDHSRIDLEDRKTGELISVSTDLHYSFDGSIYDDPNRFLLHFKGVTSTDDTEVGNLPMVFSYQKYLYVQAREKENISFQVFNTNGQLVYKGLLYQSGLNRINTNLVQGFYLVNIRSDSYAFTQKVFIE